MTDTTAAPQQAPAFPIHKSIWAEITDYLGKLPFKVSGGLHSIAKKGLEASAPTDSHVNVAPEFLNTVLNTLAEQPTHLVADIMDRVSTHVQETSQHLQAYAEAQAKAAQTAVADVTTTTTTDVSATTTDAATTATPVAADPSPAVVTTDAAAATTTSPAPAV